MRYIWIFLCVCLLSVLAFAQSTTSTTLINMAEPTAQEIAGFIQSLGGWKALGAMGIVMSLVQMAILVIRSNFVKLDGKIKLLIVLGLSLGFGLMVLTANGMSWGEALLHSQTLAAFQVFANQIWKQFVEKEDGAPPLA